jgi:ABC-type uncharacterized transport system auxiliary subunit
MKKLICAVLFSVLCMGCGQTFQQEYYMLNYRPSPLEERFRDEPYPFLVRVRKFDIEKIYQTQNIVFRKSPFQLQYYGFRHWAVQPADMLTDLLISHLSTANLVNQIVHRFDDADRMPDYEISGRIEAMEEYNSEDVWFAYLRYVVRVKRIKDAKTVYSQVFDLRKKTAENTPESVVRAMSEITDFTYSDLMEDLDSLFYHEYQQRAEESYNE